MLLFGHLGIGSKIVAPWSKGLPRKWLLWGTLFPDLIDKPLYYSLSLATGKHGHDLGLICGTRTFGHTSILLVTLTITAWARKSKKLAALAVGAASHLLLDSLGEQMTSEKPVIIKAVLWPLLGLDFPSFPHTDITQHFWAMMNPYTFWTEAIGLTLIAWDYWKIGSRRRLLTELQAGRSRVHSVGSRHRS